MRVDQRGDGSGRRRAVFQRMAEAEGKANVTGGAMLTGDLSSEYTPINGDQSTSLPLVRGAIGYRASHRGPTLSANSDTTGLESKRYRPVRAPFLPGNSRSLERSTRGGKSRRSPVYDFVSLDLRRRSRAKRLSFSRGCPDFQSSTKGLIAPDAVIKAPCSRHRARVGIAAFSSRGSRFSIAACFLFAIASTEDRTPAAGSIRRSYPSASHEYPPALRKSLGNSPDYHWQSLKAENHRLR
nr:hypothetical protein Iba_chr01aCG18380 [Ipomoea batatas]